MFAKYARLQGLFVVKNDLSCQITYCGGIRLTHTELDFTVVSGGRVGFFDTKECKQRRFAYSALNKKQVERSSNFNRNGVPSGFVVWFRTQNRVELITGARLASVTPRTGIACGDGIYLGKIEDFDVKAVLNPALYRDLPDPQDELPISISQAVQLPQAS